MELVAEQLQRAGLAILQPSCSQPISPQGMPLTHSEHQLAEQLGAVAIMEADMDADGVHTSGENLIVAESGSVFVSDSNSLGAGFHDGHGTGGSAQLGSLFGPTMSQQQQQPVLATVVEAEAKTSSRMALVQVHGQAAEGAMDFVPLPRDLQFWPELVDSQQRIATKLQKAVFQGMAWYRGAGGPVEVSAHEGTACSSCLLGFKYRASEASLSDSDRSVNVARALASPCCAWVTGKCNWHQLLAGANT